MEGYFLLLPVALTSLGAWALGRRHGLGAGALRPVLARVLECVGLTVLFAVLNTALGAVLALLWRALSGRFVSLYLVTDSVLLGLSAMQALALRWWWQSGDR